ncbi:hypothetical protein BGW38_001651 [Lunasporangiospora selenospora]|uniref:Uncharacterized protein n=1 Tax=Lunasporangiospora selenospora TaxID=979761 RepID=A0A9P6KE40_9FUNG|nr:hypothetical protein BGW38_001651 [Lunasporangiospora selenospora]
MTSLDQHTTNGAYYNGRHRDYDDDDAQVDEEEEYREDLFLRQHYGRQQQQDHHGLIRTDDPLDSDDSDDDATMFGRAANHYLQQQQQQRLRSHNGSHIDYDSDDDSNTDDDGDHDDYSELDMDQHSIQLLSGSMSVRSPFLDAIREEEEDEPAFTSKPSSYPTFNSGRYLNRRSGEGFNTWTNRASSYNAANKDDQSQLQELTHMDSQQQQDYNSVSSQDDIGKPRGPRPLGRPRSNTSSLTKVTLGFDVAASSTATPSTASQGTPAQGHSEEEETTIRPRTAPRSNPASPESTIQDLEVKRVLEGAEARAAASATAAAAAAAATASVPGPLAESSAPTSSKGLQSTDSTPLPSASTKDSSLTLISSRPGSVPAAEEVSFGQDTQKSIDDFFGMVKSDLDKRIQEAIREVEQKFLDRVQKLEQHTSSLAGGPLLGELSSSSAAPAPGSLMESLTKPLPPNQNPGGSLALRKEILSHVTEKVGDLDLRVNQMEVLVSYKLVDIESKVKDLHGAHNSIAQKVHQVANSHQSNMQGIHAGKDVGYNTIDAEQRRVTAALQPYRGIDSEGKGAPAEYLKPIDEDEDEEVDDGQDKDKGTIVSQRNRSVEDPELSPSTSMALVDTSSSIVEMRHELQSLGQRYQDLNEGLLSDLMGQMRDAKLMLFQTVDEVDSRISRRVDRIEAEMHSKLLSEIEGRVQERVRAMEQSSSRLERCFDKMEGRLAALETVLASKRPRPESMYQLLQQQLQQQQQEEEEQAEQQQQPIQSLSYNYDTLSSTQRPRRRTLAEQESITSVLPPPSREPSQDTSDQAAQGFVTPSDTVSSLNGDGNSHLVENKAPTAGPFDGFVSIPQTRPVLTPVRGSSGDLDSTISSHSSSYSGNSVSSPLERGTVIGNRMGTIHNEYKPRTTYVPSTPTKEKSLPSFPQQPPQPQPPQQESSNRARRISLSGFDANSLSALKPVRSPTSPSPSSTGGSLSSSSLTTLTTTTTTTTTMAQLNDRQSFGSSGSSGSSSYGVTGRQGNGTIPKSMSATSLLTARLHSPSAGGSASTSANSTVSQTSEVGAGVFATMTHRSMSYDTIHAQGIMSSSATSTLAKSAKPAQGASSYRELLHFWKGGGGK